MKNGKLLQISTHLVVVNQADSPILYHALAGKAFRGSTNILKLIDAFKKPCTVSMAAEEYGYSEEKIWPIISDLKDRHMLVPVLNGVPKEIEINDPSLLGYPLKLLRLYVTKACNMACTYCFEAEHVGPKMDLKTCKDSIQAFRYWLDENPDPHRKLIKINFFGGEPLICQPMIKQAIPVIHEIMNGFDTDYRITINTNATLITPKVAEWLVKNRIHVYTSLDGLGKINDTQRIFPNGKGAFKSIIKGLSNLIEQSDEMYRRHYLTVLCTVSPKNCSEINELALYLRDVGIRNLSFNAAFGCVIHTGVKQNSHWTPLSTDALDSFVHQVLKLQKEFLEDDLHIGGMWGFVPQRMKAGGGVFCQAVGSEIGVSPQGDLFPCPTAMDMKKESIGYLNNCQRFVFNEISEKWSGRTVGKIEKCKSCSIVGICRGGCPATSLLSGHDIYDPKQCEYWLSIVKAFFESQVTELPHYA